VGMKKILGAIGILGITAYLTKGRMKGDRAIFWDLKNNSLQNVSKGLYLIQEGISSIKSMV